MNSITALGRALVRLVQEESEIMEQEAKLARGLQVCQTCGKKYGHYIGDTKYGRGHCVTFCDCGRES